MSASIVTLPMYDWPEIRSETDQFYNLLRESLADRGFSPPERLDRQVDLMRLWSSPDLLLAQTCGLPLVTRLKERVSVVGTPSYDIDCSFGQYFSVLVVHRDSDIEGVSDLVGARFACNDIGSQSGYAAPLFHLLQQVPQVPASLKRQITGSHRAALQAVARGEANVAAIDAVTWAHARRYEAATGQLRVLGRTPSTPGLPFITAKRSEREVHRLYLAVVDAMAALNEPVRDALLLLGFSQTRLRDYRVIKRRYTDLTERLEFTDETDKVTE
ncbi:phosphate/phosphite/phosphonate ABC transporter substrate-binding protein [Saccharospirillum salsuginis]|uniref:Phosphate ABC transporter substrate-binding protein n=1 Tax=Saccharospirillum salsuginis TaxID=418750 RepID=A0A918KRE2_9GAMM|nr:PhnD/SsuA/transferrin family substrate-binding protein [Saccharospirillum salsuginis]GGX71750.1 phosphate ABC transporter substrate-binding protein [Saccharospirillum salsuginis]